MENPWNQIDLDDYERHMSLDSVRQLQVLDEIMADQFERYPVHTAMVFGIAGGNGLDQVKPDRLDRVYGVDINGDYLNACVRRYPGLKGVFVPIQCDLQGDRLELPRAELVIANLFIEYVGYANFQRGVRAAVPEWVSCVIQVNTDEGFVSDSPYLHVFDRLEEVHREIEQEGLTEALAEIGYRPVYQRSHPLPNGKALLRLDFQRTL